MSLLLLCTRGSGGGGVGGRCRDDWLFSIYLQGIDSSEIIHTVHSRPAPVIPATAGLHTML